MFDDRSQRALDALPERRASFEKIARRPAMYTVLCAIGALSFVFAIGFTLNPFSSSTAHSIEQIDDVDRFVNQFRSQIRYVKGSDVDARPKFVCYYTYPAPNDSNQLRPEDIDQSLCTHINVGFATIQNCSIVLDDELKHALETVASFKKINEDLKVLVSIGGAPPAVGFSEMVQTHASRKIFIRSLKLVLRTYDLDGVDLDWEFPMLDEHNINVYFTKNEKIRFSQLLREIRTTFIRIHKDYLLTVAVAAPEPIVTTCYDVEQINIYVDFVNLMSYDFHFYSAITPFTGFNAPLFASQDDLLYLKTLNINYSSELWISSGMDRDKIVVGLPAYGHSFTLVNNDNVQPGSPAKSDGELGENGFVHYPNICEFIKTEHGVNLMYNNETVSPYLSWNSEWVSYDDENSIELKTKFIKEMKYGGVMIYSLNSDDFKGVCSKSSVKFPLCRRIKQTLL